MKQFKGKRKGLLHTGEILDQLCYGSVVGQRAPSCLHVGQLRHKLLYFSHCFRIVAPLKDKNKYHFTF